MLIEKKMITPQQLEKALEMQASAPQQPIEKWLVKLGYMKEEDLRNISDVKDTRPSYAEILLRNNFIDRSDLKLAIEMSKSENLPLKEVLRNLEFVSEENLAKAIALQHNLPFVKISDLNIQMRPAVIDTINPAFAAKEKLIPLTIKDNILTVAMSQPLSHNDLRVLENAVHHRIRTVIASEQEILKFKEIFYKKEESRKKTSEKYPDLEDVEISQEEDFEEEATRVTEKDNALVKLVNQIVYDAHMSKASDIHIEPYPGKQDIVVRFRIDGCCETYQHLPFKYKHAIVSRIKIMANMDISERRKPQDGKINFKQFGPLDVELRVATMPTAGSLEDVVIRILSSGKTLPFESIGLNGRNLKVVNESIRKPHGLILVVGPTGSGKTTTLHSCISLINTQDIKIWTAEDPIEITQPGLRQVQVQPKIGFNFATALRSFLRLDPDVIMVGEMRDLETAAIAIEASLTGHLVFSTLHTNSAPETVTRLLDMGLDPFSFSDSLLAIIAQRLARKACENCKEVYRPERSELEEIVLEYGADSSGANGLKAEGISLVRAVGCDLCSHSGYRGRIGIHEILDCSDPMKSLIKAKSPMEFIRHQAVTDGMTTLKQDGMQKVFQGLTDMTEIRRVCLR